MCVVYICKKVMNKKLASKQYAANQMGVMDRKRPKKSDGGGEGMSCSKEGCGAYNSGSGRSGVGEKTNRQNKGGAKGLSSRPQYASRVMSKKQADKRAVKLAEKRAKAAQPKKMKAKF